jgi:hypothetical protein
MNETASSTTTTSVGSTLGTRQYTTTSNTTSSSTSKKPLLIFKHYPKAGGGSIEMLLREFKTNVYQQTQYHKEYRYICSPPPSMAIEQNSTSDATTLKGQKKKCKFHVNLNDTLVIIPEFSKVYLQDHNQGFVISSIREPCDQYLSLWSYGSNHAGMLYNDFYKKYPNWTMEAYGQDPPTFDSPRDIHAFRNVWLKDKKVKGLMTKRFYQSFGRVPQYKKKKQTSPPSFSSSSSSDMSNVVDCWIYLDDFQATLYTCLRQYEHRGGYVNWTAPLVSALVEKLRQQQQQYLNRLRLLKEDQQDKDDPIGNPQLSHHSKCSTYFDEDTSNMVRNEWDVGLYNLFGYQSCCGGRTTFGKGVLFPPVPSPLAPTQAQTQAQAPIANNATLLFVTNHDMMPSNQQQQQQQYLNQSTFIRNSTLPFTRDGNITQSNKGGCLLHMDHEITIGSLVLVVLVAAAAFLLCKKACAIFKIPCNEKSLGTYSPVSLQQRKDEQQQNEAATMYEEED